MTILWYDLETWGLDHRWYPPAQFAAIRTNLDLKPIGEPLMFYAKPPSDMLPEPGAVLTTGITPQVAFQDGLPEAEFAFKIYTEFSKPGTITSGYNTLRFDDEAIRYSFFRNLLDPYIRESYKNDLGRWDILDLVRAARALRPAGIEWPELEGEPTNRLEHLTEANGIEHEGAHDALVDVRATIALAKLIRDKQPKLYEYAWSLRDKKVPSELLQSAAASGQSVLHTSGKYRNELLNTSLVSVLGKRPSRSNEYLVYDLRVDPKQFMQLSDDELQLRLFGSADERGDAERLPIKGVHVGKSPFVAPAAMLDDAAAKRINIDQDAVEEHRQTLLNNTEFVEKLIAIYDDQEFDQHPDVDAQLYSGFVQTKDRQLLDSLRTTPPNNWPSKLEFDDPRLSKVTMRYFARNYPDQLNQQQQQHWETFRARKLMREEPADWQTYASFSKELQDLAQQHADDPSKMYLLEELHLYAESIYPEVMHG